MNEQPFKPAWWLRNSHLQTLWPALVRRPVKSIELEYERIELPDGDFIDLCWANRDAVGPLVILLHGFEGSIESHYAKGLLKKFNENGWRGVLVHFRGCSGEPNRLLRGYHSGETSDIKYITHLLREREPWTEMAAVGVSLGGNVLLKWLGETGAHNPLTAAIAISVPFELHKAASRIQKGFSRVYQWHFLRCLQGRLCAKHEQLPVPLVLSEFTKAKTLKDFDDTYTAPLHGFNGVDEYYHVSSSRQYLANIQVPTLILHAKDDPFMSEDVIPNSGELSPYVNLEVTERGGHVGFVSGRFPWRPEYWLEKRVPQFLQDFFKPNSSF